MKNRDLLLVLLVIAAIGLFLWQLMQKTSKGVESLSAATAKALDAANDTLGIAEQSKQQIATVAASVQAQNADAPDFVAQFNALLDSQLPTTNSQG